MKRLLLIDAYAFIYRAYYAFSKAPMTTSKGMNTAAIYGFIIALEELLRLLQPTHIAVAFDPKGKTFRHEAYEQYKAQRPEAPEDIHNAVPYIKSILSAMNITTMEHEGFEADDVIGTVAKQAEQQQFEVYMATPDKDYGQLVSEHIFIFRPRHNGGYEKMGPKEVCLKYDLEHQNQVIDLLGLMGDASDNIPGCPGVGEKTAVKLLQEFGSIDNLLAHTDQLKGALKSKVEAHTDDIRFSRFLATIRTDVPVKWTEQQLLRQPADIAQLTTIYRELEFRSLLRRLTTAEATATTDDSASEHTTAPDQLPVAEKIEELTVRKTNTIPSDITRIALSIEKISQPQLDLFAQPEEDKLRVVLAFSDNRVLCSDLTPAIRQLLENRQIEKVGFDLKNDIKKLLTAGVSLQGPLFDLTVAHYLLQPENKHDIELLSEQYLRLSCEKSKEQKVAAAMMLRDRMPKAEQQLLDMEMQLIPVLAQMEMAGVRFDNQVLSQGAEKIKQEAAEVEKQIFSLAGVDFNVNSPRQVGEVLFEHLQLDPKAKKTKGGQYVTSEETLLAIADRHPIIPLLLEYRELKKLLNTYFEQLPELTNPLTGKVHTTYNQTITATGRLSSSNPNLQNLPIRSEKGRDIRRAVVADPGCLFLSADYSQIELRLMAHFSQDQHLINAFRQAQDIHAATAAKIFSVDLSEVTPDMRRKAKTANFGIIYGISAFGLAQQLNCSRTEAKEFIDNYFLSFPAIVDYIERVKQKAHEDGYVQTLMGRRRYLPDINSRNPNLRNYAERNAVNAPIQGTAADIIKMAMIRIFNRLRDSHLAATMIMQIHDELCFNVPEKEIDTVRQIVVSEMENIITLSVPLIADAGVGHNWLEAH